MFAKIARFALLLTLASVAGSATAQQTPPAAGPVMQECTGGYQPPVMLRRSLQRIAENYPSSALRLEEEGIVRVAVTVGVDGRALDVEIIQRAASEALNNATIDGVLRYGRFSPALQDCTPVVGELETSINWMLA